MALSVTRFKLLASPLCGLERRLWGSDPSLAAPEEFFLDKLANIPLHLFWDLFGFPQNTVEAALSLFGLLILLFIPTT